MLGRWVLDASGESIVLSVENDGLISVPGFDIWRAEFELEGAIAGYRVAPPSEAGLGLVFVAESGDLSLVMDTDTSGYIVLGLQLNSVSEILTTMPAGDQLVRDGRWYCLDPVVVSRVRSDVERIGLPLGKPLTATQVLALTWKESVPSISSSTPDATRFARPSEVQIDSLVDATLYPYQEEGVRTLVSLYEQGLGCLLADEMGLGKTIQVISLLAHAAAEGTSLVVCPASTLANWGRELSKFAPQLKVHIHQGPKRWGGLRHLLEFDVILTPYDTLAQDVHFLKAARWSVIALDEAQYVKNPRSIRATCARMLACRSAVAITGTPIENSLRDMWSVVSVIAPGFLSDLEEFSANFPDETWAAKVLGRQVSPLVVRRTVSEVGGSLPGRVDTAVPIRMGNHQAEEYEKVREIEQIPLAAITALRAVCASTEPRLSSVKQQFLHEVCAEAFSRNKKVLIFASFSNAIKSIAANFRTYGSSLFVDIIDGSTAIIDRQAIIDGFEDFDGPGVLVLNPRAAGVGLNIQAANYVVHYTPEWNPAVVDQASARAHRTGQLQTVFVYTLYYENTVEEVMIERLITKRGLQQSGLKAAADKPVKAEITRSLQLSPLGVQSE